ncbi:zinc finger BED domain-containing protein RICESLEEPER 1-like isoform X2 [Mangifera indica]|uniref:zinc finger BED domain-containing protein RICESLEEPER 1-like isoform X2 n=2 Tax=Mangifera indica TaxID=29780 RepID=UPI001CF9A802|nr:zinc finger BED domain-containing protein RICESLEEPER 1-like isoform X2 [Mangifera indica]
MEPISTGSDARLYFQVGKMKISEGIKHFQDLVEWCKNNSSPENDGTLHDTMTYLQSLPPQIQVIESLARQGDAFVSNPHINEQEITQIREQNVNFKPIPNLEINMGTNKKRKLRSDVWNHFLKYENEDKEVKAKCQYCKKDFDGSSKNGTTHLWNHQKSCLKNLDKVTNKVKDIIMVDQELNHSNLARKVIKYGLINKKDVIFGLINIKEYIFEVYNEEKKELHIYLNKLFGRFNVIIGNGIRADDVRFVKIWFIDDKWKLKTRIIHLENYDSDEDSLKRLIEDWNIDTKILSMVDQRNNASEDMVHQLTNWLNERVSLPVIGDYDPLVLSDFVLAVENVTWSRNIMSEVRELKDYYMTLSNEDKFDSAVKQVESMGKEVTSKYDDFQLLRLDYDYFKLLDWAMGYKEVFCELKRIDPHFTSSNFDWDDATSLHSFWVVVEDIKKDIWKLRDSKLANECFPMVYDIFSKMLQFKNTENRYFRHAVLHCGKFFDECCNNFKLVIIITVILDPRFKLDIVEDFYNEVYDNEGDLHLKKIMDDVTNIYNEYAGDVNNSSMVRANANEAASSKSEFKRYLTDSKVSAHEKFDILEWWRYNSLTYPTLAMMARDFLSIPIIGRIHDVHFEDGFVDIYNGNLDDDLKYAMTCTKVWLNDHDCM